jgi:hypothetical protein
MPLSKYPRRGYPIAPSILTAELKKPFPSWASHKGFSYLNELSDQTWYVLDEQTCIKLGDEVINAVSLGSSNRIRSLEIRVPMHLRAVALEDIELTARTFNLLQEFRRSSRLGHLSGICLDELLHVRGFGIACLIDLLTTLEGIGVSLEQSSTSAEVDLVFPSYPRYGETLAPTILTPILRKPLPLWAKRQGRELLTDLRAESWQVYSEIECRRLGKLVLGSMNTSSMLEYGVVDIRVVVAPSLKGIHLEALDLPIRARHCLERAGLDKDLWYLTTLTIGDLLELRNFGVKSLLDLLCALETAGEKPNSFVEPDPIRNESDSKPVALCEKLTIQAVEIKNNESIKDVTVDDVRLPEYRSLRLFGGVRVGDLADKLVGRAFDPPSADFIADELEDLRVSCLQMTTLTLNKELESVMACFARRPEVALDYLGWAGEGKKTLNEVGMRFSITRERVRQIVSKVESRIHDTDFYAPILDRAISVVQDLVPCTETRAMEVLKNEGITDSCFRIHGITTAAKLLGIECGFRIVRFGTAYMVVSDKDVQLSKVISIARKLCSTNGAACLADLDITSQEILGISFEHETIKALVEGIPGAVWLDEGTGWFWLRGTNRNPLKRNIRNIMSVCKNIELGELREGLGRHHRSKGFAPPRRVLAQACRQMDYKVEGNRIVGTLDWQEVLRGTEYTMVKILADNGMLMNRRVMEERCLESGIGRPTFYSYLIYSPVLAKYAPGVYGVRGATVSPAQAESLVDFPRRNRGRKLLDYGWMKSGRIWLGFNITKNMLTSGFFSIPSAMKKYFGHHYEVKVESGAVISELKEGAAGFNGLTKVFKYYGLEEGDCFVLEFDLANESAKAIPGGRELILNYQDDEESIRAAAKPRPGDEIDLA